MKDAEYYMNLPYRIEIIKDAEMNSFVAYCTELEECITAACTAESSWKQKTKEQA